FFLGLDDVTLVPLSNAPLALENASQANGTMQFSWNSTPGLTYQVQYRTDLGAGEWVNLGAPVIATGPTSSAGDTISSGSSRFYRVVLLP
ncbi:MAG TPA: hypothetical protein VHI52_13715, partial [Verrucomicrobiae bacterium]|nr:hypothetical protein [Verrucomicrobiae bacterium]